MNNPAFSPYEWSYNEFGDILCKDGYTIFSRDGATEDDIRLVAAAPKMYKLLHDLKRGEPDKNTIAAITELLKKVES